MALFTLKPTKPDILIARAVARNANRSEEIVSRGLTWGADEKLLLTLASIGWLASRHGGVPLRRAGNHALLVTVAASLLPHLMKSVVDQKRPDRLIVLGHFYGIPVSGKPNDAFPSGHALHMGALASAAGALPVKARRAIRTLAILLSLTRVAVLAHWASDVIVGFALGAILELGLRHWTGYPIGIVDKVSVESPRNPERKSPTCLRNRTRRRSVDADPMQPSRF